LKLQWAHLESGIDAEVVGRYGSGNETRLRRLKGDGSDLDAADDLIFQTLIVDLNVVVGGEVALGVVVDGQVHSLADDAAGPDVYLVIQPGWLEPPSTTGVGVEQQRWATALIAEPVGTDFESDLAVHGQVGILLGESEGTSARFRRLLSGLGLQRAQGFSIERQKAPPQSAFLSDRIEDSGHATVPGKSAKQGRKPVCPKPGSSEDLRLLQDQWWSREGQPNTEGNGVSLSRIGLASQDPRKRDEAEQGDEKARHSSGTQR
jgi:hypothetical protein